MLALYFPARAKSTECRERMFPINAFNSAMINEMLFNFVLLKAIYMKSHCAKNPFFSLSEGLNNKLLFFIIIGDVLFLSSQPYVTQMIAVFHPPRTVAWPESESADLECRNFRIRFDCNFMLNLRWQMIIWMHPDWMGWCGIREWTDAAGCWEMDEIFLCRNLQ